MKEKLFYKSGDGESWLESYSLNGTPQELTDELRDVIERKYDHIIRKHDHDDASGNGTFEIVNGTVLRDTYTSEND